MNMSVIIAQQEELDEIYRDFAKDMENYLRAMNENVDAVHDIVEALKSAWVSENYDDFRRSVARGMEGVVSGLERGEALRKVMIEQEKQLAVALEKLRQKYGE